jgi:hypothetical protein
VEVSWPSTDFELQIQTEIDELREVRAAAADLLAALPRCDSPVTPWSVPAPCPNTATRGWNPRREDPNYCDACAERDWGDVEDQPPDLPYAAAVRRLREVMG